MGIGKENVLPGDIPKKITIENFDLSKAKVY
jgi:hypothetical protein